MTDKDFKQQNNYREVECCGNCKHFNEEEEYGLIYKYCTFTAYKETGNILVNDLYSIDSFGYCDKWEHE